jgi:hypothetical protein
LGLPFVQGASSAALACNFDGEVIVGQGLSNRAFVWTEAMGPLDLASVLSIEGADTTGWTLVAGTCMSADGTSIAGYGQHNGLDEGWVCRLGALLASQPSDTIVCDGQPVSFTATAVGEPLTWTWLCRGSPVVQDGRVQVETSADGHTSTITFASTVGTDGALYNCIVSDGCTSIPSSTFRLYVNSADFNGDGDIGTDSDIAAFFACLSGSCCPTCGSADFNGDGDIGTDADIESFFRVLGGGPC